MNQRSIRNIVSFKGKGLHTGREITMKLMPAPVDYGVVFRRVDMAGMPEIKAVADSVISTDRSTLLGNGDATVSTVEHLLATLLGTGIDNLLVEIDGPEVPILDGSAKPYAEVFTEGKIVEQASPRRIVEIKKQIVCREENGSEITICPAESFSIELSIDYDSDVFGVQEAGYDEKTDFRTEIAPAKTFVFVHELEPLLNRDLIKGGDLDNAVVIAKESLSGESAGKIGKLFGINGMEFIPKGYVNKEIIIFKNECARHKLLDLMGDLFLAGGYIAGKVTVKKPGHKINTKAVKMISKAEKENFGNIEIPVFDPAAEPVMDINRIKRLLPHRPPFLMVDRIIGMNEDRIVGIKTIGINEGFFIGHFPDESVMPGVLIVEAMAQAGGILVLSGLDEPEKYSTYFAKIDNARFKRKVVPGDILTIVMTLTVPLRRSIVCMKGEVYVGNILACSAEMVAQVIKNK